ncbi:CvpA family protein, partial [Stenotrophomonas sp. A3_2]
MNYVDLAVLGILGISALLGLSRGLVREVLGIGAWA